MTTDSGIIADGRYELFESIGSGGMATVYRGHDQRLGVDRAIKVLSPSYASKKKVRARFEAEARTMAVLDHPNIVRVYDVGSNDETAWIVMELIDGPSLLGLIKQKILDVNECLRITAAILEALTAAHAHGVVHRDIKPHNVLISKDGSVRITDFGIARIGGNTEDSFTKTGTVMGTWAFMAPEQRVDAKGVDHTADIYGLGATLFAMATGETPMDLFASDLDPNMLSKVPEDLIPLIRRATRYQRDERYPNSQTMLQAVSDIQVRAQDPSKAIRSPRPPAVTKSASFSADTPPEEVLFEETVPDPSPTNVTYIPDPSGSDENEDEGIDVNKTPPPFRPRTPTPEAPDTEILPTLKANLKKDRTAMVLFISMLFLVAGFLIREWKSMAPTTQRVEQTQTPKEATSSVPVTQVPPTPAVEMPSTEPATPMKPEAGSANIEPVSTDNGPPNVEPAQSLTDTTPIVTSPAPNNTENTETTPPTPITMEAQIEHGPATTAVAGSTLNLKSKIKHLRPVDLQQYQMTVYYRASGQDRYRSVAMNRDRLTWSAAIPLGPDLESGLEYFIKAKPLDSQGGRLKTLKSADNLNPHSVQISLP